MQELQKILRGQQELFLTALPMHIVLAIDECSDSDGSSEFLGGMVECMMKHGLGDAYLIVLYIEEEEKNIFYRIAL